MKVIPFDISFVHESVSENKHTVLAIDKKDNVIAIRDSLNLSDNWHYNVCKIGDIKQEKESFTISEPMLEVLRFETLQNIQPGEANFTDVLDGPKNTRKRPPKNIKILDTPGSVADYIRTHPPTKPSDCRG